jgi:8-oxo-dGTP diphosphatase
MEPFLNDQLSLTNRYQLVPRTLIFIEHEGKIVFIEKRKNNSVVKGQMNGVGGHVEMGEEPYESAMREIREETGLQVTGLEMAAIIFIDTSINPGIMVFVFKAVSVGGILTESGEGKLVLLLRDEAIREKRMMEDIPLLLEICQNHKSNDPPRLIRYKSSKNEELRIDIIP